MRSKRSWPSGANPQRQHDDRRRTVASIAGTSQRQMARGDRPRLTDERDIAEHIGAELHTELTDPANQAPMLQYVIRPLIADDIAAEGEQAALAKLNERLKLEQAARTVKIEAERGKNPFVFPGRNDRLGTWRWRCCSGDWALT
jgi:hypothetical protein